MTWLCVHGHTAEAHPQCYKRAQEKLSSYESLLNFGQEYGGKQEKMFEEKEKKEFSQEHINKWIIVGNMRFTKSGKMLNIGINKGTFEKPIWENYFIFAEALADLFNGNRESIQVKQPVK